MYMYVCIYVHTYTLYVCMYICVTVCIHSVLLSLQIGGEWLGGNNAKTQFRRSLSEDLRGVAASLVEQLVY